MNNLKNRYRANLNFQTIYSPETQGDLQRDIWRVPVDKRDNVWFQKRIPYNKIEKAFIEIVKQRINFAKAKGFKTEVEYFLNLYNIPANTYKVLLKNADKSVNFCRKALEEQGTQSRDFYSEFGNHCYLCSLPKFPFTNLDDVEKVVSGNDTDISKIKYKLKFIDNGSSYSINDKKIINIFINNNQNIRHQVVDLVHELFHAKITAFKSTQNKFIKEKLVLSAELEFYKKLYPDIYKAMFGELLKVFHRVLFEIELYKKPDQNLSKLYAKVFNMCYGGNYQKINRSYILDDLIMRYPFQNLPHMLVQIKLTS